MYRNYTLECSVAFIGEEQSKAYKCYAARVPQAKMLLSAESALQRRALPGLERRGA